MRVLNAAEIYAVEQAENSGGIAFIRMMENAGSACANVIRRRFDPSLTAVVCGRGKNGGDGFVIARKLAEAGFEVAVVLAMGLPQAEDAKTMYDKLTGLENIEEFNWNDRAKRIIHSAAVVVDAVFGIGYSPRENALVRDIFETINSSSGVKVAVDIPSGLESDSAAAPSLAVEAELTIAVSCLKPAHVLKPASYYCGETVAVDIGLSQEAYGVLDAMPMHVLSRAEAKELFPKRSAVGHKGVFGHALSVCGSRNMQGAAVLAAKGAVRSGAGLVTAAFPEAAYSAIAPKLTEPLMLPLPSNSAGTLHVSALPALTEHAEKSDAVLLGCGLGLNLDTREIVESLVSSCTKPLIIDADGINAVAENINILKGAKAPIVMTPHPGEMARLTGVKTAQIESDRIGAARSFAAEYGVTLLLKGASTVIASPDGEAYVNTTGNPGLAKGGSGDLLAGIILALLAQGMGTFEAAALGAYLHGLAGDSAAEKLSCAGMTPSDCADELASLLADFEEIQR